MMQQFDFCLLIPCYNNVDGLRTSLESVSYDPAKFIILVVDDGSKEKVNEEEIKQWLGGQTHIVVLRNERNLGITATLNHGLRWIKSNLKLRYIARLDCGDTCEADRFQLQVSFMEEHPEIGLVGSWCRFEDRLTGKGYTYKAPARHEEIVRVMYSRNAFIHPTIMFRGDLLDYAGLLYPENFEYAEDYALCWKIILIKQSFVFQKVLVTTEINKRGLSFANKSKQLISRWKVVNHFGIYKRLKIIGFIRICLLLLLPKRLILRLKEMQGN